MKPPKEYLMSEWESFNTTQRSYALQSAAYDMPVICPSPLHVTAERMTSDYGEYFAKIVSEGCPSKYYSEAVTWFGLYKKAEIYENVLRVLTYAAKEAQR